MKYLKIISIAITVLSVLVGGIALITNRLAVYFPLLSYKQWLWSMTITTLLLMLFIETLSVTINPIGRILSSIGAVWMGLLLYFILAITVVELANLIIAISPSLRGSIAVLTSVGIIAYGYFLADNFIVKEITIPISGLTKNIKAVHITDIHLGNFRGVKKMQAIVDKISEINPVVVFNTGDQFDNKRHFHDGKDVLEPFKKLKVPQYFVYGNHDQEVDEVEVVKRMKNIGAIVLQNEQTNFGELQIIGLNNIPVDRRTSDIHSKQGNENIEDVLNKLAVNKSKPTILLHHRPEGVEYAASHNIDLMLAGHTHGGQLFPISLIANKLYKYSKGLHHFQNLAIYVSEGLGTIFTPVRLGTNSDLTIINLVPKNN